MLKAKQLRDQTVEELEAALLDSRKKLYTLRIELKRAKKLDKPHQLNETKKDVAKILTVLTEKRRTESLAK